MYIRIAISFLAMLSIPAMAEEYVRDGPEVIVQDSSVSVWHPEQPGSELEIFIEDEILPTFPKILFKGISDHDTGQPLVTVHLASSGGNLLAAVRIAAVLKGMIREGRVVRTYVTEYSECMSACMVIFMSGSQRYVSTTSSLGFHQASDPRNRTGIQSDSERAINDVLYQTMIESGISIKVAEAMRNTPTTEMYFVNGYMAIENGIATHEIPIGD